MLDIYAVSIQLCRACRPLITQIAIHDRNLADQLRRAVTSVALNIAESDGQAGGHRKQRRFTALGSAREVAACIDIAEALQYIEPPQLATTRRLNQVTGTLVNLTRA